MLVALGRVKVNFARGLVKKDIISKHMLRQLSVFEERILKASWILTVTAIISVFQIGPN